MTSKAALAIQLSKLKQFKLPKPLLEQYSTDSEIAADILWNAFMLGDIKDKVIADLGAGTGVLGIGCIELGAEKVYFVEKDKDAVDVLKQNTSEGELFVGDVGGFSRKVNTVIMNPPFGVQKRKADKKFVEKAFEISTVVYYIGKTESRQFIEAMCKDAKKTITHFWKYELPLKKTMSFHTQKKKFVEIGCWRIES